MELLIGMGFAVVVMLTAMSLLQFLLRMSAQDPIAQTGAFLAHQTMRAVTAAAEGSWSAVAAASGGGVHRVVVQNGQFSIEPGLVNKTVNAVPYTIEITIQPVKRTAAQDISQSGVNDPSTKKVITTVSWTQGGNTYAHTLERYVARTRNEVLWQTDWVGGPTVSDTPVSGGAVTNQFQTADTRVDYVTVPGSIKIKGL